MKKMFIMFILFSSCAVFKVGKAPRNLIDAASKVCLSSAGQGRLLFSDKKYVFSYESALDEVTNKWTLVLSFPLHAAETFEIDWSKDNKVELKTSLEERILRENDQVNPEELHQFVESLGFLLRELIGLRSGAGSMQNEWVLDRKSLSSRGIKNKGLSSKFYNFDASGYYGIMNIAMNAADSREYQMDLVVKDCFESEESQVK